MADWSIITVGGTSLTLLDRSGTLVDVDPPVVANVAPAPSTMLATRTTPIQFDVYDVTPGFGLILVKVKLVGGTHEVVAHNGTSFTGAFNDLSSRTGSGTAGTPYHYSIVPDAGWTADIESLVVYAVDADGNIAALTSYAWSVPPTPLAITFSSPAGTEIGVSDVVILTTTDDVSLRVVMIFAAYQDREPEVIFDGASFRGFFQAGSERTGLSNGFSFKIARSTGWLSSPTIEVYVANMDGEDLRSSKSWMLVTAPAAETPSSSAASVTVTPSSSIDQFLGFGLVTPFRRDQKSDFASDGGARLVASSVSQILGTECASDSTLGELPWRGDFGSLFYRLRHANNDEVVAELARHYGAEALARWEPRVRVTRVSVRRADSGVDKGDVLEVLVQYNIVDQVSGNVILGGLESVVPV